MYELHFSRSFDFILDIINKVFDKGFDQQLSRLVLVQRAWQIILGFNSNRLTLAFSTLIGYYF